MQTIHTKYHGIIEIESDKIITFEQGIPSFEEEKQFVILPFSNEDPFFILQSIHTEALAFVMTSPFVFYPNYDIKLDEATVLALNLTKQEEALVYAILTIKKPFDESTINLQAPIIINTKKQKAKQVILNDNRYAINEPLVKKEAGV
ncbi:flagellar assembly protein FliW [Massilibacterium senegalense]|uniref:flagellar assembly protein FliW n=1 Tax=Massilibacterium senegalense TaxID=1632858 RepID=UPI000783BECC|nr:flagellar assembly protein FliW [Massilibacterium senegalense]